MPQISIDTSEGTWGYSNHIPRHQAAKYDCVVELTTVHNSLIRPQPDAATSRNINMNLLLVRLINF